jgi:hypothetical protein
VNGVMAVADEIAPMLLCRPRAVGVAGIAFAALIGLVVALRLRVALAGERGLTSGRLSGFWKVCSRRTAPPSK